MTRKLNRVSPTEMPLPLELDPEPLQEKLTAFGGITPVVQAFRALGLPDSVKRHIVVKERQRGYDEATFVESFVLLNAIGGECLEDFDRLRHDPALPEMVGHAIPSPEAARKFLYEFHADEAIEAAKQQRLPDQIAYIPGETEALRGLARVNRDSVIALGRRCPDQRIATVDLDTTIIESRKQEALMTYEGERGYQPMVALWAEMDVVLADEFRDGNVPAVMKPLNATRAAFSALPETVTEYYFRGDAACYENELMTWLDKPSREGGPGGTIGFAISAPMSEHLQKAIRTVADTDWRPCGRSLTDEIRECADVVFVPEERSAHKGTRPLRYVAIRIRKRQGDLFANGSNCLHFAVVTNLWSWDSVRLVEWHREKAGTVELLHDVIKNELAGGVMPCGRFGANAAWFRLALLAHNVLTALKRLALPAELLKARPKRLRFKVFYIPGRVIHHARKMVLRLAATAAELAQQLQAAQLLVPHPLT
jgi:hypothetical protein